jgi:hypothetical protein
MKSPIVDDDRWESAPPAPPAPAPRREEAVMPRREDAVVHAGLSPDTCVFGAVQARPKSSLAGMPSRVALRADVAEPPTSERPVETVTAKVAQAGEETSAPIVAGQRSFEDSETSAVGIFRRSVILRGQSLRAPARAAVREESPAVRRATLVASPMRSPSSAAVVVITASLTAAAVITLTSVQRAIEVATDAVVSLLVAIT